MMSAALRKMAWICAGFVLRHDLKAFWAASVASVASVVDAEELVQSFSPLEGLVTSNVVVVVTSLPSIQRGTGPERVL